MENKDLIKLAVDIYKGVAPAKYDNKDTNEVFRQALISVNGGTDKITPKGIRDGVHTGLFAIVEEALTKTVIGGLPSSCPLFQFVEMRNLADGDTEKFIVKDEAIATVHKVADGVGVLRRQRFTGGEEITVDVALYGVATYEELRRLMAGRITWIEYVNAVSKAFTRKINELCYNAISETFKGLKDPYKISGTFSEEGLYKIIDHVQADNPDKIAIILGSEQSVRKINGIKGYDSHSAKEDLYNTGVVLHVGQHPVIPMPNAHKLGTDEFILDDALYVIAADEKFLKLVHEGDTYMFSKDPTTNEMLQQELYVYQRFGVASVMTRKAGYYELV